MFLNNLKHKLTDRDVKIGLRTLLIVLFVLQVIGVVSLVSYLSYRSQRQTIEEITDQLTQEVGNQVTGHLDRYLQQAQKIIALNKAAIETGELNPTNPSQLQRQFWQQMQIFDPAPTAISFSTPEGQFIGIGYDRGTLGIYRGQYLLKNKYLLGKLEGAAPGKRNYYLLDDLGNPKTLVQSLPNWDVRKRPWYQEAVKLDKQTWAKIYPFAGLPLASLVAVAPVYFGGEFKGVLSSDLLLSDLNLFLAELDFSSNGQAFIIDRLGNIVATSTQEKPFVKNIDGEVLVRLKATQSQNGLTRTVAQKLEGNWKSLNQIKGPEFFAFTLRKSPEKLELFTRPEPLQNLQSISLNESGLFSVRSRLFSPKYFVRVVPYRDEYGLDWLVAVVIPESDYMEEINAMIDRTVLGSGLALFGSILVGFWATRLMTRPLFNLRDSMFKFSQNMEQNIQIKSTSVREFKQLNASFLTLANQLNLSFYESQELNQKLAESEKNTAKFLDGVPVGVAVHDRTGKQIYLNREGKRLLGDNIVDHTTYDELISAYQIYVADTNQPYPQEQLPLLNALRGESAIADDMMIKREGVNIYLEVRSTPIFNSEQRVTHALVVFQDITLRRDAEIVLINYSQQLEYEVKNRTEQLREEIENRRKIEENLRETQARFQALSDAVPVVIFSLVMDGSGGLYFEYVSREIEQIYEVSAAEFLRNSDYYIWAYMSPEDASNYEKKLMKSAENLEKISDEWRMTTPSGQQKWLQVNSQPQRRENGEICWSGIILDISDRKRIEIALRQREIELRQANQKLKQLSRTDALTQVANRGYFETYLREEWRRAIREKYPISLLLLDVDYFKRYNDRYGHPAGDYCLKEIARAVQNSVRRPADLVARYGGEEFAIVLVNTDEKGAVKVAEKIRHEIRGLNLPHEASEVSDRVTVSIGISSQIPALETQSQTAIERADRALYAAKERGRDRYVVAELI